MAWPASPKKLPVLLSPLTPRFIPGHSRSASRSPTRHRPNTDDILSDLSPTSTLEAFTSGSGILKASIEAASPTERAFGVRAVIASKNINGWFAELCAWPWPGRGSAGFENPLSDRGGDARDKQEYWGSLLAQDVIRYESRIDEIAADMEALEVEEIKGQIMNAHIMPRSRPSSSHEAGRSSSQSPISYTKMDDFTAVVTATVLKSLPNLSHLMSLMNAWTIRLAVLRQTQPLLIAFEDAEAALRSGWKTIGYVPDLRAVDLEHDGDSPEVGERVELLQETFEIMRIVLEGKVTALGQQLDQMLDSLEGRSDTIPDAWLDRMEDIEEDYGEWVVLAERRVGESDWAKEVALRKQVQALGAATPIPDSPPETPNTSERPYDFGIHTPVSTDPGHRDLGLRRGRNFQTPEPAVTISLPTSDITNLDGAQESCFCPRPRRSVSPKKKKDQTLQSVAETTPLRRPNVPSYGAIPVHDRSDTATVVSGAEALVDGYTNNAFEELQHTIEGYHSESEDVLGWVRHEAANPTANLDSPSRKRSPRSVSPGDSDFEGASHPLNEAGENHSTPANSSPSSEAAISLALKSPSNQPLQDTFLDDGGTPRSPSKVARYGHSFGMELRRPSPPFLMSSKGLSDPFSVSRDSEKTTDRFIRREPHDAGGHMTIDPLNPVSESRDVLIEQPLHDSIKLHTAPLPQQDPFTSEFLVAETVSTAEKGHSNDTDANIVAPISAILSTHPSLGTVIANEEDPRLNLSTSSLYDYASSEPSPEVYEAQPAEYFRPSLSPVMSVRESPFKSGVATPVTMSRSVASDGSVRRLHEITTPTKVSTIKPSSDHPLVMHTLLSDGRTLPERSDSEPVCAATSINSVETSPGLQKPGVGSGDGSIHSRRSSFPSVDTVFQGHQQVPYRTGTSYNTFSTTPIVEITPGSDFSGDSIDLSQTPSGTPAVDDMSMLSGSPDFEEESPSISRIRMRADVDNYSPSSSTSTKPTFSEHSFSHELESPQFSGGPALPNRPSTPSSVYDAPSLPNVEVTSAPAAVGTQETSDSQLRQQISDILESIPARITLTSGPVSMPPTHGSALHVKKRASAAPLGSRSSSRSSTPTPSFTLAPAYAKNPRPRPQSGNPEIKLYHLSRSTGEAPIKLHVRLVGEHGERVMVRVGGGWADLGAYLKEYALHHGRHSDMDGKIEIQEAPSRAVSSGFPSTRSDLRSGSVSRNGASSPISRPGSSLERPMSSLTVRKTRMSVGDKNANNSPGTPHTPGLINLSRPTHSRMSNHEFATPDSAQSYSSSQINWAENEDEETELGLAGPRGRNVSMSAESMAWVESMKVKVRVASAEKQQERDRDFGGLGRAGNTKRLFKKSG